MPSQVSRGIYCIAVSRHRHCAFIKNAPAGGILLFLAVQETFYLWLMKNLRPTYDPNGQKQGKTGNSCKKRYFWQFFTQPRLEHTCGFLRTCALPATKFPIKITGNFFGPIRKLSANNREFYKYTKKYNLL